MFPKKKVNCSQRKAAIIQFYKTKKRLLNQTFMLNSFLKK